MGVLFGVRFWGICFVGVDVAALFTSRFCLFVGFCIVLWLVW